MGPRSPPVTAHYTTSTTASLKIMCHFWANVWVFFHAYLLLQSAEGVTHSDDVNGLLALQDAWNAYGMLQWSGNDPCGSNWSHIACDNHNPQRVIIISVSGLGLSGTLPDDIGFLTGLQSLDMSHNKLRGQLSSQLGRLVNLVILKLESNEFTGTIPPALGQLRNVQYIYLTDNMLQGPIPHEIGLLRNLYWLDLANNHLQGELPYSSDGKNKLNVGLDNLTTTKHFHFNNNSLEGPIPSSICHQNMQLIHMLFDSNQMSGNIPDAIGDCLNLTVLKIDHNHFSGEIPTTLDRLVNLSELHLTANQLTGVLPDLSNLNKLNILAVGDNQFTPSEIPAWLTSLRSLTDLQMQKTNLLGSIPESLFELPTITAVNLDNNILNGTLDLSTSASSLLTLSLINNRIDSTSLGKFNQELNLQGNPVCNTSALVNSQVCNPDRIVPPISYQTNNSRCSNPCTGNFVPSPLDCSCVVPYKCHFTYRAPYFTTLSDSRHLKVFVDALAKGLNMSDGQIMIPEAFFNSRNQLFITAWLFPSESSHWSPDDIVSISGEAGSIYPSMYGPPMFQADPYDFQSNARRAGLSTGAKVGIGLGAAILALIIFGVCAFALIQKRQADQAKSLSEPASGGSRKSDSGNAPKLKGARWFSFIELKKATNNFSDSNEIGAGGYGKVYKGELPNKDKVAIKRSNRLSMQGAMEFKNEIELLSRVHHRNLVSLVGFCIDQGEQMLVYEFIENGSLRDALTGVNGIKLDWHRRLLIALGAARGLAYLHELANPPIIHRDVKSSNILLDVNLDAKVADFGLSKLAPDAGKTHVTTQVKGTVGYLDPEYYLTEQLTEKSDVYSYGVVLLELLTSRQPIEFGKYIVREAKHLLDRGGMTAFRTILDTRLQSENTMELQRLLRVAIQCVEECAVNRPTMSEVVKELEEFIAHESGVGSLALSSKTYERELNKNKRRFSDSDWVCSSKDSSCNSSFHYAENATAKKNVL
ncbi:hypothetical protein KP509_12G083900 [Ceratopteris richardii]|uniref:non-specific serine/threonine protein kinase n=1 Tax=Ceratopteris richardii TaxID=49495 RepID=A0A8T2TKW7_CERRI|nr:hypothetical protein KP509_12G083900 [Ceratopteris richardii]